MAVGRFYIENVGITRAALRRFENVVRDYQTSNQVPEALFSMVEAYLALGLVEEADRVGSVAVYNYPDSFWTKELLVLAEDPQSVTLPVKASSSVPSNLSPRLFDVE